MDETQSRKEQTEHRQITSGDLNPPDDLHTVGSTCMCADEDSSLTDTEALQNKDSKVVYLQIIKTEDNNVIQSEEAMDGEKDLTNDFSPEEEKDEFHAESDIRIGNKSEEQNTDFDSSLNTENSSEQKELEGEEAVDSSKKDELEGEAVVLNSENNSIENNGRNRVAGKRPLRKTVARGISRGKDIKTKQKEAASRKVKIEKASDKMIGKMNRKIDSKQILAKTGKSSEEENKLLCDFCGAYFTSKKELRSHVLYHRDKKRNYKCHICEKSFPRPSKLKVHMYTHSEERQFSCSECGKSFRQDVVLKRHMFTHVMERPHKCTFCPKSFASAEGLKCHLVRHTNKGNFECFVCNKNFHHKAHLQMHIDTHTVQKQFDCEVCGKKLSSKWGLKDHMTIHTGKRPYLCDICGAGFNRNCHLRQHMRIHTGERPFVCCICDRKFRMEQTLANHMLTHCERNKQGRELSQQEMFDATGELEEMDTDDLINDYNIIIVTSAADDSFLHKTLQNEVAESIVKGEVTTEHIEGNEKSEQVLSTKQVEETKLEERAQAKTGTDSEEGYSETKENDDALIDRNVQDKVNGHFVSRKIDGSYTTQIEDITPEIQDNHAAIIPKKVKKEHEDSEISVYTRQTIGSYSSHLIKSEPLVSNESKTVIKVRAYECTVCKKPFQKKFNLDLHMRSHTGDRPFLCGMCPKRFASKSTLGKHYLVHSGLKEYKCDKCEKSFATLSNFKAHQLVHTGEKNFKCDVCHKSFALKGNMMKHRSKHL